MNFKQPNYVRHSAALLRVLSCFFSPFFAYVELGGFYGLVPATG